MRPSEMTPRTACLSALNSTLVTRHTDGEEEAGRSGGRVPENRAEIFDEQSGDQVSKDPGFGELLVLGG